jgi:hypothetical protein
LRALRPASKVARRLPTKGIGWTKVFADRVLQQVAYQRNSPFGVSAHRDAILALGEGQRKPVQPDNVSAALRVEQIRTAQ